MVSLAILGEVVHAQLGQVLSVSWGVVVSLEDAFISVNGELPRPVVEGELLVDVCTLEALAIPAQVSTVERVSDRAATPYQTTLRTIWIDDIVQVANIKEKRRGMAAFSSFMRLVRRWKNTIGWTKVGGVDSVPVYCVELLSGGNA